MVDLYTALLVITRGYPLVIQIFQNSGCSKTLASENHPRSSSKNGRATGTDEPMKIGGNIYDICLGYLRPKYQGISPQFMWPHIWYIANNAVPTHLLDPEDLPLIITRGYQPLFTMIMNYKWPCMAVSNSCSRHQLVHD